MFLNATLQLCCIAASLIIIDLQYDLDNKRWLNIIITSDLCKSVFIYESGAIAILGLIKMLILYVGFKKAPVSRCVL